MVLHNLYHSLIILAHRPFISDGHIRSTTTPGRSWEQCTIAARCITGIASVYRSTYGLNGAPYVLAYTVYVACTIHVRNAASQHEAGDHMSLLKSSLQCLDELCTANPGVIRPANSIRRLIEANKLSLSTGMLFSIHSTAVQNVDIGPEEASSTEHDTAADLDTSSFPYSIPNLPHPATFPSNDFRMDEIDFSLPLDPLFGWINVATPSLYEETT
jgi:hypothetical protein